VSFYSTPSIAVLSCHPSTPCPAIHRVTVQTGREGSRLALKYRLEGDIDALAIPPVAPPQRADGLWQTTCFEVFITVLPQTGSVLKTEPVFDSGYYEFNFSPSTAWAAYAFTRYRQGMAMANLSEPVKIAVCRDIGWLELESVANLGGLGLPNEGTWHLGLSAVIRQKSGDLSYWAYAHPQGKPDFHHPDSFAFELEVD
jgi:hypothetical protein